jgi:hypothetical protein
VNQWHLLRIPAIHIWWVPGCWTCLHQAMYHAHCLHQQLALHHAHCLHQQLALHHTHCLHQQLALHHAHCLHQQLAPHHAHCLHQQLAPHHAHCLHQQLALHHAHCLHQQHVRRHVAHSQVVVLLLGSPEDAKLCLTRLALLAQKKTQRDFAREVEKEKLKAPCSSS